MTRQPSIFLPHGGGPCFFMDAPPDEPTRWVEMANYLRSLPSLLPRRPAALLVISGHWEMPVPTLLNRGHPDLLFDYYNFPPHTYRLTYPAPGATSLVPRVEELLAAGGFASAEETERGYDHGVFIPMKVAWPDADVPILQLSLLNDMDPARHIALGRAIAPLRDENVVILGSGLSFHNLRAIADPRVDEFAKAFDDWLADSLCAHTGVERDDRIAHWDKAPAARLCHPREEHLMPLMVALGAGGNDPGRQVLSTTIWGKAVSAFHFG